MVMVEACKDHLYWHDHLNANVITVIDPVHLDIDRTSFPSVAETDIAQCKTLANTNLLNLTATFCSIFKY